MHGLRVGSTRYLHALLRKEYRSGSFLASPKGKMSGRIEDQRPLYPMFGDQAFQDAAWEAMHRHMPPTQDALRLD